MIRKLPDNIINRIAAGEVIERPFAAIKELVENSIDAGSSFIEITVRNGGKSLITVNDDGIGMDKEDLSLAVERHATSKLPSDDLVHISSLGFRGEALPSIGSVSRLKIISRKQDFEACEINVEGGIKSNISPASLNKGTKVEIRDLFYATPARLKFLKSDKAENQRIREILERLAMAYPDIRFKLTSDEKTAFDYENTSPLQRLKQIMGTDFAENSVTINAQKENVTLSGFASLPTLHSSTNQHQYFFVNGRPVNDKLIIGAIKAAYMDFIENGRHPMLCLFLNIDPDEVDVNVHPAKAEVRFRDSSSIRGLIISGIKHALAEAGHKTSHTVSDKALSSFKWDGEYKQSDTPYKHIKGLEGEEYFGRAFQQHQTSSMISELEVQPSARGYNEANTYSQENRFPLGAAKAQLHKNYIVAQNEKGIVIVDQHAAHERLVYERMKKSLMEGGIKRQALLIPEIIEMSEASAEKLLTYRDDLEIMGLSIDSFGSGAVVVNEIPAIIGQSDIKQLVKDLADDINTYGQGISLKEKLDDIIGRISCHGSVRLGRILTLEEMNALLREMEKTPHSGQCKHGRPTYIELDLKDIEKLFGRK